MRIVIEEKDVEFRGGRMIFKIPVTLTKDDTLVIESGLIRKWLSTENSASYNPYSHRYEIWCQYLDVLRDGRHRCLKMPCRMATCSMCEIAPGQVSTCRWFTPRPHNLRLNFHPKERD